MVAGKGQCHMIAIVAVIRQLIVLANALLRDERMWSERHPAAGLTLSGGSGTAGGARNDNLPVPGRFGALTASSRLMPSRRQWTCPLAHGRDWSAHLLHNAPAGCDPKPANASRRWCLPTACSTAKRSMPSVEPHRLVFSPRAGRCCCLWRLSDHSAQERASFRPRLCERWP